MMLVKIVERRAEMRIFLIVVIKFEKSYLLPFELKKR